MNNVMLPKENQNNPLAALNGVHFFNKTKEHTVYLCMRRQCQNDAKANTRCIFRFLSQKLDTNRNKISSICFNSSGFDWLINILSVDIAHSKI